MRAVEGIVIVVVWFLASWGFGRLFFGPRDPRD